MYNPIQWLKRFLLRFNSPAVGDVGLLPPLNSEKPPSDPSVPLGDHIDPPNAAVPVGVVDWLWRPAVPYPGGAAGVAAPDVNDSSTLFASSS